MMGRHFRTAAALLASVAMATSLGCYAYRPLATGGSPTVGEQVRVVLTGEGVTEMARYLGPNVSVAEGTLTSMSADGAMIVGVAMVQTLNGIKQPWTGEGVVAFPPQYRSDVQQRVFLRNQTIVASVIGAAALVAVAVAAFRIAGGAGTGGDGTSQPPP